MMFDNALDQWSHAMRSAWGQLDSRLVESSRCHLERLAGANAEEEWLASLHRDAPDSRELYRDPHFGFVLQAHSEVAGTYRPPHDHGRSWVIYAVQRGVVEMGSYAWLPGRDGRPQLVKREAVRLSAGEARVYLPGDIHDTFCLHGPATLLRFTERDLRVEKEAGRITRYVEEDGAWVPAAA